MHVWSSQLVGNDEGAAISQEQAEAEAGSQVALQVTDALPNIPQPNRGMVNDLSPFGQGPGCIQESPVMWRSANYRTQLVISAVC